MTCRRCGRHRDLATTKRVAGVGVEHAVDDRCAARALPDLDGKQRAFAEHRHAASGGRRSCKRLRGRAQGRGDSIATGVDDKDVLNVQERNVSLGQRPNLSPASCLNLRDQRPPANTL